MLKIISRAFFSPALALLAVGWALVCPDSVTYARDGGIPEDEVLPDEKKLQANLQNSGDINDPSARELIQKDLEMRLRSSKDAFGISTRDRILSELIRESLAQQLYGIATQAAVSISMPLARDEMLKVIIDHCKESGSETCQSTVKENYLR